MAIWRKDQLQKIVKITKPEVLRDRENVRMFFFNAFYHKLHPHLVEQKNTARYNGDFADLFQCRGSQGRFVGRVLSWGSFALHIHCITNVFRSVSHKNHGIPDCPVCFAASFWDVTQCSLGSIGLRRRLDCVMYQIKSAEEFHYHPFQ